MTAAERLIVHLHKQIHERLCLDVSFSIGSECVILFGRSGAGKTTLLRLIAGLEQPDRGSVSLDATVLADTARRVCVRLRDRRIGMMFQHDLLFPHLNIEQNIRFGLNRLDRRSADRRLAEVSALCGVEQLLNRRPETLSGGERQRVGLARALAPRPRLLLCDEPVSALDLAARGEMIERLRIVQQAEAIPMLYVTHSPAESVALGSRLLLMRDGEIVDDGSPLDVLSKPRDWPMEPIADVRNVFHGRVASHDFAAGESRLTLDGGPTLTVARRNLEVGATVTVSIRADDILLARGVVEGLSARNRIAGVVEQIVPHNGEAEVIVRAGESRWIVSVVTSAVEALGLTEGVEVVMILKARSCHVQES
jgi:molybdate transport system ATP-binding protein